MVSNKVKSLRSQLTEAERRLWYRLRAHRLGGFKFKRQVPIGSYIVDFACLNYRLVVEVDGGQHANSPKDRVRDEYLRTIGFHVLRFWNSDVLRDTDIVLAEIEKALRGLKTVPLSRRAMRATLSP